MSLLIVAADGPALQVQAPALADALRPSGNPVLGVVPCHMLVREAVRLAPLAVVAIDDGLGGLLQASLALLAASLPLPLRPCCTCSATSTVWQPCPSPPRPGPSSLRPRLPGPPCGPRRWPWWPCRHVAPGGAVQAQLSATGGLAETLLVAAESLAARLAVVSGRQSLRVVNLCGRQRMLSQRLAKQALLAGLLPAQDAAAQANAAAVTVREFEATLAALEQVPLASDEIRVALARARGQWQRLLDGLRRAAGPEPQAGRSALARESDALLAGFEQLTTLYEHSLQVLMN